MSIEVLDRKLVLGEEWSVIRRQYSVKIGNAIGAKLLRRRTPQVGRWEIATGQQWWPASAEAGTNRVLNASAMEEGLTLAWAKGRIARPQMIQLKNVTKEYDLPPGQPGLLVAADNLSLEIPKGEIFGLVGPNGAGKTTTLKMVCGLLAPTSGTISVNGVDMEGRAWEGQKHIGYLADFFAVYDELKVWEYVEYFASAYKMDRAVIPSRVREVVSQLGLETKYESFIGGLSRGMKQRLGIARAIVHNPPLLVLDEPASGLDPKARVELKELLRKLNREGTTIFITSHVLSDLEEICTSLAIMEKGKLLRVGKIAEVMKSAGQVRRVRVRLAREGFTLGNWLSAHPGIGELRAESKSAEFLFPGSDEQMAELVKEMVKAGAPVCAVEEKTESLEALFSRLSSGEVM